MAIVLILIISLSGSNHFQEKRLYFNNLEDCRKSLEATKIVTQVPSEAVDNTWVVTATCGFEKRQGE